MEAVISKTRTTRTIAPEDIRVGEHVAILKVSYEYLSFLWCFDSTGDKSTPVRVTFLPFQDVGQPLKVLAVCLPFVVVSRSNSRKFSIDVRACQIGRVHEDYVAAMKPDKKPEKKKKERKKKKKAK